MTAFIILSMMQIRFTSTAGLPNILRSKELALNPSTEQAWKRIQKAEPEGGKMLEKACLSCDKFLHNSVFVLPHRDKVSCHDDFSLATYFSESQLIHSPSLADFN